MRKVSLTLACLANARTPVMEELFACRCICVSFTMSYRCYPLQHSSLRRAPQTFATTRKSRRRLGHVATIQFFGLVTVDLFRQLLQYLRFPQQAVQGTEPPPRQLTSVGVFQLAIMWSVSRQALGLPHADFLLETPKTKVTTPTVIDQQTQVPTLSRSQSIFLLPKSRQHGKRGAVATSSVGTNRCYGKTNCQQGQRNHMRTSQFSPFRSTNETVDQPEKLKQPDGTFKAIDVPGMSRKNGQFGRTR